MTSFRANERTEFGSEHTLVSGINASNKPPADTKEQPVS